MYRTQRREKNRFSQSLPSDQGNLFKYYIRLFRSVSMYLTAAEVARNAAVELKFQLKITTSLCILLLWFQSMKFRVLFHSMVVVRLIFFCEIIAHFTKHRNHQMSTNEWESKRRKERKWDPTKIASIEKRATFWKIQTKIHSPSLAVFVLFL